MDRVVRASVGTLAAAILLLTAPGAQGQVRYTGQVYAMAYAWDAPAQGGGRVDAYQGVNFRLRPTDGLDVRTHFRFAQFGNSGGSDTRLYQLYGDARLMGRDLTARIGRQFMYRGAINGTFDAATVRFQAKNGWDVQAMAGIAAPYDRAVDLQSWDDGGALGLYVGKSVGDGVRANVSYFQRRRSAATAWSLAGAALSFRLTPDAFVQTELDYNVEQSTVQRFRGRAWYETGKWILTGEVGVQKPQIYEDSFFSIFRLAGYQQARAGVSYAIGKYRIGYQFIGTSFDQTSTDPDVSSTSGESIVSLSSSWGTLGVVYQGGFAGDRLGLHADARFDLTEKLGLTVRASRLEYQRRSTALDEDATAFSAGFQFQPVQKLRLHVEAQQSYNSYFDQDMRLLVRAGYSL